MTVKNNNPANSPDHAGILLSVKEMIARDKALSEKIASVIDLDKLLKPIPTPEFINKLFERNDAVEEWTKYLQNSFRKSLLHGFDGIQIDETIEESEPSDVLIDEIEDRVTEANEPVTQKRYFRMDVSGFLIDQDDPDKTRLLSPQMQRLIAGLKKTHRKTEDLRKYTGYKSVEVFYHAARKLNRLGFSTFKLTTKIAISERSIGFRLAKYLFIEIDKRNPNLQKTPIVDKY